MQVQLRSIVVREWLARRCQTSVWLAAELGVTPTYLSNLLGGFKRPSPKLRARFLSLMDIPFDDLFEIARVPPAHDHSGSASRQRPE